MAVVAYCIPLSVWLLFSLLLYVALPDIVPDVEMLRADMKIQLIPLEYLRCPLEEKCLSASADFLIRYYSCIRFNRNRMNASAIKVYSMSDI